MVDGHKVLLNCHAKLVFIQVSLSSNITFSPVKLFFLLSFCAPELICCSAVLTDARLA